MIVPFASMASAMPSRLLGCRSPEIRARVRSKGFKKENGHNGSGEPFVPVSISITLYIYLLELYIFVILANYPLMT